MVFQVFYLGISYVSGQGPALQLFFDDYIEPQFNRALIEGKTQVLFGNYDSALFHYREAMKLKPNNGAVNYELSKILLQMNNLKEAGIYARQAYLTDENNKWYILNLAQIYQVMQKNDSAIYLYDRLVGIEPQNPEYKYIMAGLLDNAGRYEKAISYLDELESQIGVIREVALQKYNLYLKINKGEEALNVLKSASGYLFEDYAINGIMAEYYNTIGKIDSAWFYYNRIVPENIDVPDVAISYGNFLMENSMADSALIVFGQLFENRSTPKELVSDVLKQFVRGGREQKYQMVAEKLSEIAYERFSDDLTIVSLYADIQNSSENIVNLEKALKTIIKQDPKNYVAWEQMLYVQSALNQNDSIIKYGERAIVFFNERPVPFYFLGLGYYMKKDYQKALGCFEEGIKFTEEEDMLLQFYGIMADSYFQTNQYSKAWNNFDKALMIDPDNPLINNNYAYYLAEKEENLDRALKMIEVSLQGEESDNVTFIDTYAWILFKLNKTREAEKIMKKLVKREEAKDPEIFEHYGDILFKTGKIKKSIKYWQYAVESGSENTVEIRAKIENSSNK